MHREILLKRSKSVSCNDKLSQRKLLHPYEFRQGMPSVLEQVEVQMLAERINFVISIGFAMSMNDLKTEMSCIDSNGSRT